MSKHQTVHLKYVCFIVCHLYLNKHVKNVTDCFKYKYIQPRINYDIQNRNSIQMFQQCFPMFYNGQIMERSSDGTCWSCSETLFIKALPQQGIALRICSLKRVGCKIIELMS